MSGYEIVWFKSEFVKLLFFKIDIDSYVTQ